MNISVTINKDNYSKEIYDFYLIDASLIFSSYQLLTKPKGKRIWRVQDTWNRLSTRTSNIPEPHLSIGVRNEAMASLKTMFSVKTWDEYKLKK